MNKNTKKILAVILLLVVLAAAVAVYFQWGPPAQKRAAEAQRAEAAQSEQIQEEALPDTAEPAEAESASEEVEPTAEATEENAEAEVTILFTVVHGDGSEKEFSITTKELTLRKALEQEGLIEGTDGEWGLYVLTVDGETVDENQQQWWCLTKDGETSMTGVDDTYISDGDNYAFTFTTGW